jgi:type I restriction enzyme S subunit
MALNLSFIQHVRPPDGAEGERTRIQAHDVLVCITGALTGNVALVDHELHAPAFVNQHVALIRPKRDMIQPRLLAYVLHSEIGRTQFKNNEYGGTKQGLGLGDVKSVFLPVPTLKEQSEICTYLDEEVKQFTAAITNLEREIALLREYRTRLTADVVTGKLDVRREKSEEGRVKSEEGRGKGEEGRVKGEGDWGKEDEAEALETEEGGEDE